MLNKSKDYKLGKLLYGNISWSHGLASKKKFFTSWRNNKRKTPKGILEVLTVHFIDLINIFLPIKKISIEVNKTDEEILSIIETYSKNSVSFHEFIEDINNDFSKEEKLSLISFLWDVAYADSILDVDEERLIRRIADLIRIKDVEVLRLKDRAKN